MKHLHTENEFLIIEWISIIEPALVMAREFNQHMKLGLLDTMLIKSGMFSSAENVK